MKTDPGAVDPAPGSVVEWGVPYKDPEQEKLNQRERDLRWRAKHGVRIRADVRARYAANRDAIRAYHSAYEKTRREDPTYVAAYNARACRNHKRTRSAITARERVRYHSDPNFRMVKLLRSRLRKALLLGLGDKSASTLALLGCTIPELRRRLESRFQPGMTWSNYGKGLGKWNMDHIKPCASFDLTDPAQQRSCFHFTNLQPLWDLDNIKKGAREY